MSKKIDLAPKGDKMGWNPLAIFKTNKIDYESRRDKEKKIHMIRPLIPNQNTVIRGTLSNLTCEPITVPPLKRINQAS